VGRSALIDSLRAKAAEDAEAAWGAARREAEKHRAGLAAALEQERAQRAQAADAAARRLGQERLAEARHRARQLRMQAAVGLAARLRGLAQAELPALAGQGGERLFAALAAELPERRWETVRVRPADADLAQARFPGAELQRDEAVSGGLAVTAEGARVRLVNTLEARLDTAWPDLLPGLVAEILATPEGHGTAA
jgi:V/A-type H+-transporting ATPase subunit E